MAFWLKDDSIIGEVEEDSNASSIRHLWKQNFGDIIRNLILV